MALNDLQTTSEKGVFYRTEPGRKNGVKADRQFIIVYKLGGKKYRGVMGWESERDPAGGPLFTVARCRDKIQEFKRNFATGSGPICLDDERAAAQQERKTREEAEKTRRDAEQNRPTIARLWQLYIEANPELKGIVADRNRYKHYLESGFADKTPDQITPLDLDRLRLGMLRGKIGPEHKIKDDEGKIKTARKPKSSQTIKHVFVLLRRIIRFGVQRKLCPPPDLVFNMPKVDNQVTEHLTDNQVARLMAALDQEEDKIVAALFKLALFAGLRRGEMLSLRWQDVDFNRRLLRIENSKGGKSTTLPLSDAAVAVLHQIADLRKDQLRNPNLTEAERRRLESELVFAGRNGKRRTDIKRAYDRIRTELPKGFRPLHGLRHHFASTLASSGEVDLYTLQKLLTHKDPATTQRYAHLRDETLRNAADVAARAVAEAGQKSKEKNMVTGLE